MLTRGNGFEDGRKFPNILCEFCGGCEVLAYLQVRCVFSPCIIGFWRKMWRRKKLVLAPRETPNRKFSSLDRNGFFLLRSFRKKAETVLSLSHILNGTN